METEIVRILNPQAHWPRIEALLRGLHEYHLPLTGVPLLPNWSSIQREFIGRVENGLVLIAVSENVDVGLLNGWVSRSPSIFDETYARIDNAYVVPGLRGTGVGQALVSEFEAWAREEGIDEIRLGVVSSNALGIAFWEAAGFTPASIHLQPGPASALGWA